MKIQITLTGQDLLDLIEQKIWNEVSKHGHPASFEIKTLVFLRDHEPKGVPLDESVLQEFRIVADATPKEDKKGS